MHNPHRTPPDAVEGEPVPGWDARPDGQAAGPPPGGSRQGGAAAGSGAGSYARGAPLDFSALVVLLDSLRRAAPAELQGRLTALIREALLTLRSLIDWYLERLDSPPREPRVEDIPID